MRITAEYPEAKGLPPYLSRVERGSDIDIRTPLWGKQDRERIFEPWLHVLEDNASDLPGRLMEIEVDQMTKIGPISVMLPYTERVSDIERYFDYPTNVNCPLDDYISDLVAQLHGRGEPGRLRPLDKLNAMERLPRNTSSGLPYFARRNKVAQEDLAHANGDWYNFPAILGWRGQASGISGPPKQRVVWMYPQSTNIVEYSYFGPLQDLLLVHPGLSAWTTPDGVDLAVEELLKNAHNSDSYILSSDFSGFDQHLGPPITSLVFDWFSSLFQSTYWEEIDLVREVFQTIELLAPDRLFEGIHGVPSGSVFTNIADSVAHLLMQYHVASSLDQSRDPFCQVQGDDGLFLLHGIKDPMDCVPFFEECGQEMNPDKQFIGKEDCVYLQRYHILNGSGGMYPTMRALNSLLGQERFHDSDEWDEAYVTLRAIMILENCKHHPLFEEFVAFVADGDKHGLGSKWPGGIKTMLSSKVIAGAAKIPGLVPSYNQERRLDGIFTFETVAVIDNL